MADKTTKALEWYCWWWDKVGVLDSQKKTEKTSC